VGLVPKRGSLLTLAHYAFPRYEFGERRWNYIDRRKPKNSEKNLSQCHFVNHKSHMDWPGRKPGPPRRLTTWAMARPFYSLNVRHSPPVPMPNQINPASHLKAILILTMYF
jgi:hypothetical protein